MNIILSSPLIITMTAFFFLFLSSLAEKFLKCQSCLDHHTVIIMGENSKDENYFPVNAVILKNISTRFIKQCNYYIGSASLKH